MRIELQNVGIHNEPNSNCEFGFSTSWKHANDVAKVMSNLIDCRLYLTETLISVHAQRGARPFLSPMYT